MSNFTFLTEDMILIVFAKMLRFLIVEELNKEFCQFCNQKVITLEDVLNDNYTETDLEMNVAEKYATIIGLLQVKEEDFEKVREFVIKLGNKICATFYSLWANNDNQRLEIIAESKLKNIKILKR